MWPFFPTSNMLSLTYSYLGYFWLTHYSGYNDIGNKLNLTAHVFRVCDEIKIST